MATARFPGAVQVLQVKRLFLGELAKSVSCRLEPNRQYRKTYEDEQENLNRNQPQCEYVLEGKTFGHIFAVGYGKQMLKDLKKRLSVKQIRKAEALASELKLTIE